MVRCLPAGYIKPFPRATESQCSKDTKAEPAYDEWFTRLERGQSFSIASMNNGRNMPKLNLGPVLAIVVLVIA
jgi:site-specific DNA recombinase